MMPDFSQSPAAHGWRMPAEWERHEATWLAWPHKHETWPGKIEAIPPIYADMVRALMPHEKVRILVPDARVRGEAEEVLRSLNAWNDNVELIDIPSNDSWARDFGPIFLSRDTGETREIAVSKWTFNSWGGKYPPVDKDNAAPFAIAERYGLPLFEAGIVLEGGSVDVNGRGTLLTTEACLLNQNRNPHLDKEAIEAHLKAYLGVTHILWLGDGIEGDDTDGHVDDLTRFVDPTTVVTVVEDNVADANYEVLRQNLNRLRGMADQDGNPLTVVSLPMPDPVHYDGVRLPASYANFYIANKVVLVPLYDCANDRKAMAILQKLFPDHEMVGIQCTDLVWGLGAIHCVTQQQPAARG